MCLVRYERLSSFLCKLGPIGDVMLEHCACRSLTEPRARTESGSAACNTSRLMDEFRL